MSSARTTLAPRGVELAANSDVLDLFRTILSNPYDPDENPDGYINIGTSENYIMLDEVARFSEARLGLSARDLSYGEGPWGSPRLRNAMAKHMTKYFHPAKPIDPDHILFANGLTSICEMLGFTIADAGDGILLPRPVYQAFQADFGTKAKIKSVFVSFDGVDQFSSEAVPMYEAAIEQAEKDGTKIRMLMLCHPHNPLGQCYPRATIIGLMQLCAKHKIHLISDEIYALSTYIVPNAGKDAVQFESVLSWDYSQHIDPNYVHHLYGMSKDFAAGGLRLGCIQTQNKELLRAMGAMSQFHWSSVAGEKLATLMLEDEEWMARFLDTSRERLAAHNRMTRKLLDEYGVPYSRSSNAGFFLWIDLRAHLPEEVQDRWEAEKLLVKRMMEKKVYITDGGSMWAEEPGFFRVIFSQDERMVREGLKRVMQAVKG